MCWCAGSSSWLFRSIPALEGHKKALFYASHCDLVITRSIIVGDKEGMPKTFLNLFSLVIGKEVRYTYEKVAGLLDRGSLPAFLCVLRRDQKVRTLVE